MRNFLKQSKISGNGWSVRLLTSFCVAWFAAAAQGQVLFSDNFSRTNDPAPITPWLQPGTVSSTWAITGGTMQGTVPIANPNNYGIVYLTNSFTNYSVQAQMRFTSSNAFGGGIGGYVNTTTGARYAAWLYPENSTGGGPAIRLVKFSAWTTFGYLGTNFGFMAVTNLPSVGTNLHTVRLAFTNSTIQVFYDGNQVISTTDAEATPYTNGALSFDMFVDTTPYNIIFANYTVAVDSTTPLAVADTYNATSGTTLTVAAPGVLANDTDGVGPLTAVSPTSAAHGTATLNTNGGFTYTPNAGFSGVDTFTYKANDGHTSSAAATVTINVAADIPPVANNDSYTLIGNTTLTVSAPGVLANDTETDGQNLTAILVTGPTNGLLTLTNNGSFGYVPTNNFSGTDTFTYKANDGISNSTPATVTLNVLPTSTLLFDNFQRTTLPPWIVQTGNWLISGGALVSDLNSSYGFAYLTNIWTNYTVQGQVAFSAGSYGGGIGGRLTSSTGTHYGAWIYPEGSPGGGPALRLVKFANYTTFGYPAPDNNFGFMAQTNLTAVGTGFHTLKMALYNNQIAVYFDGTQMISVPDTDATTYPSGGISADMFAGAMSDDYSLENVVVSALANDDSYTVLGGNTLNVSAPGVLANDTPVFTTNLTASQVTGPSHGSLTLNANGSFTYTPTGGFSGQDSFTYQANDGSTNIGTATVNINVVFNGPSSLVFSENFDGVTAPALPVNWTTTKTGVESNWVTITNFSSTPSNAAFVPDVTNIGTSELVSPTITLPSGPSQVTFKNRYNMEIDSTNSSDGFDGGVLEIKIGTNAFTDVIAAGGSFLAGAYNTVINSTFSNPLAGRAAWSGNSGGFITTTVDLPPAAAGQSIQLKWRAGTDNGNIASGTAGWWIDTVSISNCPSSVCWNTAPVLPSQTNVTVNETVPLTVTNTATDTDSPVQTLTYTLLASPSGASVGLHTGIITWTSTQSQSPSTNTFTTKVTDSGSPALSATNSFQVFVTEVNIAPTLTNQANRTNFGLASFAITNAATETNIHAVTTGYGLSGQPTGMTITTNGVITWSPQANQVPGTYTISTVASNRDNLDLVNPVLTATNSFVLTASTVHNGPTLPNPGPQTVNELVTLTVTNTATDLDVPVLPLTYFLTNASPTNANITTNGIITWTPQQNQSPSTNTITTVVTDGSKSATNSFQVIVKEINVAPVPPTISPQTVNELTQLTVTNTAAEANIHSVVTNYTIVSPLTGMSIDTNGIFTWTPQQTQSPGTNTVTIVVANTNKFDTVKPVLKGTNSFQVIVKEINVAPVPPTISPQTVNELNQLTVTNTATETNIHSLVTNYTIVGPLAGMNITTNGIITWTPQQNQSPATNTVTIVVANTNKFDTVNPVLTATNSFTVTVKEVNQPPTLPTIIAPQTINEGLQLTVTDTATETNIHSTTTGYAIVAPLLGMNIDSNGIFTWTPQPSQSPSTNTVTVVVTNSNPFDTINPVLTATNSFTVAVKEVNVAPVLPVITPNPQTVNELNPLTVTNTATEPNPHSATTGYTLVAPLLGMNIDSNGVFTWTPQQSQSPGTNTVTTVVANTNAFDTVNPVLKTTNSFTVVVQEVNQAPTLPNVGPQTVNELNLLTVTNTATETNIHSITTSYTLVAPLSGMNIDSNGVFTWTPQQAQSPGTNTVTVVVANTNAFDAVNPVLTATNSFTVVVNEVNQAPVLPVIGPQAVLANNTLRVTNSATESNVHSTITGYTLVSPQLGMAIDANGIFTWTPNSSQSPSTNVVTTIVSNTNAFDTVNPVLTATNTFTVVVQELNQAPVLPVIDPQTVNELNLLTVTNTASEPNSHSVTTGYTLVAPLTGMNIDSNGIFTWTPQQNQSPGTNIVTTVVANTNSIDTANPVLMTTNTFTVVVKEVNQAPTLPAISPQTVNELNLLTVTNAATETNIHSVTTTYTLVAPVTGMNIDTNGVFTWTPQQSQSPGMNTVTVVVANTNAFDTVNPVLMATNSFTVVVKEVNQPPTLSNIAPQAINEGLQLTVTDTATETNIHSITTGYTIVAPLLGMNIDSNGVFTWTPQQAQSPSTNTVTIVVANTNGFDTVNPVLTATNSFTVVVQEVNQAPVLPVIAPQTVNEKVTLTVTNTATEPNIHSTTTGYSIVGPLTGMSIDTNGIFTWATHQSQSHSTNTITIVAANTNAFDTINPVLTATNTFTVVVKEVNQPPILPIVGPQTVNELTLLTVTNTATETNIHSVTTGYTLVGSLTGMNIDSNGIFTWTPQQNQSPGTNIVTVVAANTNAFDTDNPVLTATNTFTVVVNEVNQPPTLPLIGPQTVIAGSQLTVTNAATNANIHAVITGYGLVNPPLGASISAGGLITWTPATAGTNTITTVVTNNDSFDTVNPSLTATNTFTVVVTTSSNNPPPLKIQSITLSNGVITIAWNSATGQTYQVQYKGDFTATNWQVLGTNITATNTVTTATDTSGDLQRFYRVAQLAASSNQPPILPSQTNLTVTAGTPISVTNTATDPDGDSLTYQLTNSPATATISSNGIITWTPASAGTNTITTIVTDNGQPPLSATNSFQVVVNPASTNNPPNIQSIVASGGNLVLTWSAVSGDNYQVQYKTNITDASWTPIVPNLTASGSTLSLTNAIGSAPQQFFRIVLVP